MYVVAMAIEYFVFISKVIPAEHESTENTGVVSTLGRKVSSSAENAICCFRKQAIRTYPHRVYFPVLRGQNHRACFHL